MVVVCAWFCLFFVCVCLSVSWKSMLPPIHNLLDHQQRCVESLFFHKERERLWVVRFGSECRKDREEVGGASVLLRRDSHTGLVLGRVVWASQKRLLLRCSTTTGPVAPPLSSPIRGSEARTKASTLVGGRDDKGNGDHPTLDPKITGIYLFNHQSYHFRTRSKYFPCVCPPLRQ